MNNIHDKIAQKTGDGVTPAPPRQRQRLRQDLFSTLPAALKKPARDKE